jgi:hypothetical protein
MFSKNGLAVPMVKHSGFFYNLDEGFSSIASKRSLPQPEKTLLRQGVLKVMNTKDDKSVLYCFSDGLQDDLIVTVYEQMSKSGLHVYLKDKALFHQVFREAYEFISQFDTVVAKRIFVTFTGGATLSQHFLATLVQNTLKTKKLVNFGWNTWHWIPNNWMSCSRNSYIVKLDLAHGHVKSFETSFSTLNRFINQSGFIDINRKVRVRHGINSIDSWFNLHPEFQESKSRVEEILISKGGGYAYKFFQLKTTSSWLFIHYPAEVGSLNDEAAISRLLDSGNLNFLILHPRRNITLPDSDRNTSIEPLFPNEVTPRSTVTHRKPPTKTAPQGAGRSPATPSKLLPKFVLAESDTFKEQFAVIEQLNGGIFCTVLNKIAEIRDDLLHGRLTEKKIDQYYVYDLTSLGGGASGRGAWRLLITRKGNVLTFHCIADYHQNRWKIWS